MAVELGTDERVFIERNAAEARTELVRRADNVLLAADQLADLGRAVAGMASETRTDANRLLEAVVLAPEIPDLAARAYGEALTAAAKLVQARDLIQQARSLLESARYDAKHAAQPLD